MTEAPQPTVVWAEIPVTDLDAATTFYSAVLQATLTTEMQGPNLVTGLPGGGSSGGHLYVGTPAARGTGPSVHLGVPGALEDAMERARVAGAEVISPPIPMPFGRFAYIIDPDGNSIGLFEPAAAS